MEFSGNEGRDAVACPSERGAGGSNDTFGRKLFELVTQEDDCIVGFLADGASFEVSAARNVYCSYFVATLTAFGFLCFPGARPEAPGNRSPPQVFLEALPAFGVSNFGPRA